VQPEAAPSLSLFDLCSRTNKDRRWKTTTAVESRDTGSFAGRRTERRRGRTNAGILLFSAGSSQFSTDQYTKRFL
jgi:hypothetical protein